VRIRTSSSGILRRSELARMTYAGVPLIELVHHRLTPN
jgi:hypothetical protein